MRVLAISGSLREGSHNTALLRAAADLLPPSAELELFDGLREVPPYDQDDDREPAPEAVRRLRLEIEAADAVLFATPEYNSSIPGQLKNALDWASRPLRESALRDKPVTVIGASAGSFGAVWAQAELRKVLAASGARVVGEELPVARAEEAFDVDGRLADAELEAQLARQLADLVAEAKPQRVAA
jgi:chromate reductase